MVLSLIGTVGSVNCTWRIENLEEYLDDRYKGKFGLDWFSNPVYTGEDSSIKVGEFPTMQPEDFKTGLLDNFFTWKLLKKHPEIAEKIEKTYWTNRTSKAATTIAALLYLGLNWRTIWTYIFPDGKVPATEELAQKEIEARLPDEVKEAMQLPEVQEKAAETAVAAEPERANEVREAMQLPELQEEAVEVPKKTVRKDSQRLSGDNQRRVRNKK